GFAAFSLLDASKSLRTFFSVFDLLLGIFGSLALAVATLGIVNTLVMAILERRREIGVLKALGAADSDVQQLFFVEAGVMGLFGGFFGVLFGWLLGRAITFGTNVYLKRQNLNPIELSSVPWWLVIAAIAFAILVVFPQPPVFGGPIARGDGPRRVQFPSQQIRAARSALLHHAAAGV